MQRLVQGIDVCVPGGEFFSGVFGRELEDGEPGVREVEIGAFVDSAGGLFQEVGKERLFGARWVGGAVCFGEGEDEP